MASSGLFLAAGNTPNFPQRSLRYSRVERCEPGHCGTPPDATGQPIKGPQKVTQWSNTAAYQAPQPGYYGNASIGTIRDPGLVDFDMALYKNFHIWRAMNFSSVPKLSMYSTTPTLPTSSPPWATATMAR
jgi:hypothetical protein